MTIGNKTLQDGEFIQVPMPMMDAASLDAAEGGRDGAWRAMVDHLNSAWQGDDAVVSHIGDAEATQRASEAAAEATQRRLADARTDAESAHAVYVEHLGRAWGVR